MIIDIVGLEISVPTMIWTFINFFLLMFLLNKLLFKPMLSNMDKRQKIVEEGLKAGEEAELKMKETNERLKNELAEAHNEARALISESRFNAEKQKSDLIKVARSEAADIRRTLSAQIAQEKTEAQQSIENNMSEFVSALTNKLLFNDDATDAALVNEYLSDTPKE